MTSDVQQGRWSKLIRRSGAIIGPGSKLTEVLPELFPVMDLENVPGELLILGGTFTCFGGGNIVGAVAQSPKCQLFNPVGSGKLMTITRATCGAVVDAVVRFGYSTVALTGGIGTQQFTDKRFLLGQLPVGEIRTESAVALAAGTGQIRVLADTSIEISNDKDTLGTLLPGFGFEMGITDTNTTIFFNYFWRERNFEESEVNF